MLLRCILTGGRGDAGSNAECAAGLQARSNESVHYVVAPPHVKSSMAVSAASNYISYMPALQSRVRFETENARLAN